MDPAKSAAANLFSLSALAALQPAVAHFSTHSPALEFSGQPMGADAEAKLIDYRSEKVAGFEIEGDTLICLPQAYDLFLKNLVGGLHTVYTKLKRLDVVPRVCNVEQVRALRSLGAIQPGVNRCKLISCKDFDALYQDCTSASSRPGRPPKRSPPFGARGMDYLSSLKKPRYSNNEHPDPMKAVAAASLASNSSQFFNASQMNAHNMFPLLNPLTAQHILMSQMMSSAANQAGLLKQETERVTPDDGIGRGQTSGSDYGYSGSGSERAQVSTSGHAHTEMNGDDPLNLVKHESQPMTNGSHAVTSSEDDDKTSENYDSGSETPTGLTQPPHTTHSSTNDQFLWPGLLKPELYRVMQAKDLGHSQESSVEGLLLNILGLIEIAASTVKKQELHTMKEKGELLKLLEQEKASRTNTESALKEEQRLKKIYLKRLKKAKRSKTEIHNQFLTLLEKQQNQKGQSTAPNSSGCNPKMPFSDQILTNQSVVNGEVIYGHADPTTNVG